ncbi:macrolide family glycosyltransferase [Herbidospora yilanensis]|uniref:macrolide family glycosyltransferase n=1 Tax=Herbidospora yilanensis TaxID=354426 RepID=UPI00078613B7|nr:macrolide family glycosyltransferase [Herbidospora yilanensis]
MAHIAMFAVPAHGHVNPSLALLAELVKRGHRVTFPTTSHFVDAITTAGAEPLLHDSVFPAPGKPWPYADDDLLMAFKSFFDEAVHVLPQMEKLYADDRPDLVLYDIGGYAGHALARMWGIPVIQLSPTYVGWEGWAEEVAAGVEELVRSVPGGDDYYADFTAWLAGNGIDIPYQDFTSRPERCIALIPKVLQPNADRVSPTITFVGPTFTDRAHQGTWASPGDKPVVLVSLGSAFTDRPTFYRNCVEAFSGIGWHVVLQIGAKVDPAVLGDIPADVEVHPWVPQLAILSQASAFVTHAGMGGTMEGLYHGVPMIAVPQAADQFQNADRLVELGVGVHIPTEEATPERLRQALLDLTSDDAVAARMAAIKTELRAGGGTTKAADIVEGLLPG